MSEINFYEVIKNYAETGDCDVACSTHCEGGCPLMPLCSDFSRESEEDIESAKEWVRNNSEASSENSKKNN